MTTVDFFFDPSCPWTWVTSRWLTEAAALRPIEIRWRPISLLLKHGDDVSDEMRDEHEIGLHASRVAIAVGHAHDNDAVARFYSAFGTAKFGDDGTPNLAEVLASAGLQQDLARAASDEKHDTAIEANAVDAEKMAGEESGSPVLAVEDIGRGTFGPVLGSTPTGAVAADLWDHVLALLALPQFYELSMERRSQPH
jgi:2-hydroxychromene-2-carboxylate isomerase